MSPRALRELPKRSFTVQGGAVDVRVRASPTAKTIRLRVGPEHPLEVIVPLGTSDQRIEDVLAKRASWITRKLDASRIVSERAAALGLERRGVVWINAKQIPAVLTGGARLQARLVRGAVLIDGPPDRARDAVARWYRREARRRLLATVENEATRLGLQFTSVTVRDQRTRWASCSPAKNLAFNWRLVMAPEDVQRYVVVHELCHIRIANHSKAFWRLLDHAMPTWREPAAWLREHGHELRAYRVAV